MGKKGLLVVALLSPMALALTSLSARLPSERQAAGGVSGLATKGTAAAVSVDPNLPLVVGDSRLQVARAIDDTAAARHDAALVALGRRFLGTPSPSLPVASASDARLVLDLSVAEPLRFIEQLLALVNSRQVRSRTEAVDRFSDHVRRLRYAGGRVDRCERLEDPILWALAAARRGYLVDLTPFLPGARERRLPLKDLRHPGPAGATTALRESCPVPDSASVNLVVLPLEAVPAVMPSLRSGDLFLLVGRAPARQEAVLGLVDVERDRLAALLVRPGQGVVREPDLLAMARNRPGTIGVVFLRSLPNADGRPEP